MQRHIYTRTKHIMHVLVFLRFYCLQFLVFHKFCVQEITQECTITEEGSVTRASHATLHVRGGSLLGPLSNVCHKKLTSLFSKCPYTEETWTIVEHRSNGRDHQVLWL